MKIRYILIAIAVLITLLGVTACGNDRNMDNRNASPEHQPAPATNIVIAEAAIDYDHDGKEGKLLVRMTEGKTLEETESGSIMGIYHEGQFRLELLDSEGVLLHAFDLNDSFGGSPLLFEDRRPFEIAFEDYNDDGYWDFTVGQYLSSNGFAYNIYSLNPEGISQLPYNGAITADSVYSTRFEKLGRGAFINQYYDMDNGAHYDELYVWNDDQFERVASSSLSAEEAVNSWAEAIRLRNGAVEYLMLSPDLRQSDRSKFEEMGWVTGTSSPWVERYRIKPIGDKSDETRTFAVQFDYRTSTDIDKQIDWEDIPPASVTVNMVDGIWVVSAAE